MSAATGLSVLAYRLFGARMRVQGRPLVLLTTIGARTGAVRRTLLGWFPDDRQDAYIVTATAAGSAAHPAWYLNMARHPDRVWIEVGRRSIEVRPESLRGAERDEAWRRIVALAPGYAAYEEATDRVIPVVRLVPVPR